MDIFHREPNRRVPNLEDSDVGRRCGPSHQHRRPSSVRVHRCRPSLLPRHRGHCPERPVAGLDFRWSTRQAVERSHFASVRSGRTGHLLCRPAVERSASKFLQFCQGPIRHSRSWFGRGSVWSRCLSGWACDSFLKNGFLHRRSDAGRKLPVSPADSWSGQPRCGARQRRKR